jgi:GT2 family glycosyltransferase
VTTSVIVVAYGDEPQLASCLSALLADLPAGGEVLVVDNGANLPEVPGIRVVTRGRNLGFGGGCRLGVEEARGDVLVFVNSDAVVRPGALTALVEALADAATGLVCGCVVLADRPDRVNSAGNPVHITGLSWAGGYLDPVSEHQEGGDVTAVTGALFATRRDVWDLLGGMHDDFFLYYEDTDLSLRCWLAGLRVRYVPGALAEHAYEFSRNARKMHLLERNRLHSVLTTYPTHLLARALPVLVLTEPLLLVLAVRDGWGGEKLASWWWLVRHARQMRARRRRIRREAPHALDGLLTTRLTTRQVEPPAGIRLLDRLVTAYWRAVLPASPSLSSAPSAPSA